MAEEAEGQDGGAEASGAGVDPFAAAMALGGASRAEADNFLRNQNALIADQRHHLHEQFKHLRLSIWEKRAGVLLRASTAVIGLVVAGFFGLVVWDASHINGLVIEEFSVPPDMAAKGITGQVVASQVQDKLTAMLGATTSSRPAQSYAINWGDDIKVEIPETGVSVGEAWRFLKQWLGHETHVTGEVYHTASGIAVTARTGADVGGTYQGAESDLDALVQKAAEHIFGSTQPYRYGWLLTNTGGLARADEARAVYTKLASNPDPFEQAWAWIGLNNSDNTGDGGLKAAVRDLQKAIALSPAIPAIYLNLSARESNLGHAEDMLAANHTLERLVSRNNPPFIDLQYVNPYRWSGQLYLAELSGDYASAVKAAQSGAGPSNLLLRTVIAGADEFRRGVVVSLARQHDGISALGYWRDMQPVNPGGIFGIARLQMDVALENWQAVAGPDASVEKAFPLVNPRQDFNSVIGALIRPFVALAKAKLGDTAGADALIATTPDDCYDCIRMRGNIASVEGNWGKADSWFAKAVHDGPSIPFDETDWGQSFLMRGKPDDAIAKFTLANQKGPKFADPLEGWGEALMAKNQSHLALAKFEEADKYAPNWGHLHLKWGEALAYAGKKDEAQKQFALAAGLDLSSADKSELERMKP